MRLRLAAALVATSLAAGCAGTSPGAPGKLRLEGALTHGARIGLPATSAAIVEVRDTSEPEGRGVVAEQRFDLRGRQVPVPFEVTVDFTRLDPARPYALRGAITVSGRPAWITDPVPVTARAGAVDLGTLAMRPIRAGAFPTRFQCGDLAMTLDFLGERARLTVGQTEYEMRPTRTADGARFEAVDDPATWFWNRGRAGTLSLKGREYPECRQVDTTPSSLPGNDWVVEDIDGGGIIDRSRATLAFGTDGQIAGRGSCNTYTGRYAATGDAIRIVDVASTSRACAPSLMDQEARFLAALRDARRFQVRADGALVLHTDDRRSILARRETPR